MTYKRSISPPFLVFLLSFSVSMEALADFYVTGKIEANSCSGFVIKHCKHKPVQAVKGSDGRMYEIAQSFPSVTEYNATKGRCWIASTSGSIAVTRMLTEAATKPEFYEVSQNGQFTKVDADYITFPCVER